VYLGNEVAIARRRFTRSEYYRMVEAGILGKRDQVELIKGEIVEKFPMSLRHRAFVMNLSQPLIVRLDGRARVSVGTAVALADDTDTEPDLAVLRLRTPSFKIREPFAEDALLVIEVAGVSLAYDRTTKLRLYAEAAIPEYWIVDCTTETVEVYRNPGSESYRDVTSASGTATLTLQAFPDVELTPTEIFT
jgi:Uma2 family endonuclease